MTALPEPLGIWLILDTFPMGGVLNTKESKYLHNKTTSYLEQSVEERIDSQWVSPYPEASDKTLHLQPSILPVLFPCFLYKVFT